MGAAPAADHGASVVLHSSWTGIVLSTSGAILLAVLTVVLAIEDVSGWVVAVLGVAAISALGVVALDLPVAAVFTADGVTRRAMLRHHHLPWTRVNRLSRHRSGVRGTRLDQPRGGLVAVSGRRRYALVDRMESAMEFDELLEVLGPQAGLLGMGSVARPPDGRSPTWLYRRRRWRPESAS